MTTDMLIAKPRGATAAWRNSLKTTASRLHRPKLNIKITICGQQEHWEAIMKERDSTTGSPKSHNLIRTQSQWILMLIRQY